MRKVMMISVNFKIRDLVELPEDQFLWLLKDPLWKTQCRRAPDGSLEWSAQPKSDAEIAKENEKAQEKHRKQVYGR